MCSLHLVAWGLAVGAAPEAGGASFVGGRGPGLKRGPAGGPGLRSSALLLEQVRPVQNHYLLSRFGMLRERGLKSSRHPPGS